MLLKAFTFDEPQMTLARLTKKVGLHPATCYRILQALVQEGFLTQDPESTAYSLGISFIRLGEVARQTIDLRRIALPYVEKLAKLWGETTNVDVLDNNLNVDTVLHIPSSFLVASIPHYAFPLPPHCTSTGKALLAYMDANSLERVLSKGLESKTIRTITDREMLSGELTKIRSQGYATNIEELEIGLIALGAPIFDASGKAVAAISMGGPTTRISENLLPEIAESLMEAAQKISAELGYTPKEANPRKKDVQTQ